MLSDALQWVLHLDDHLKQMVIDHGAWTYLVLFTIVFCETGLVVTPFLPGDSLLFIAGSIAASAEGSSLRVEFVMLVLMLAALCGDNVNYWIGRKLGPAVFRREDSRWLKKKHLERTQHFFERYGGKAIILARFVPIVRTFTPFVAGIGRMHYPRFLRFCVIGAALWVGLLTMAGYWFGRVQWVKDHFEIVVVAIIVISLIPAVVEFIRARRHSKHGATSSPAPEADA